VRLARLTVRLRSKTGMAPSQAALRHPALEKQNRSLGMLGVVTARNIIKLLAARKPGEPCGGLDPLPMVRFQLS
jgi:hypothetical protein